VMHNVMQLWYATCTRDGSTSLVCSRPRTFFNRVCAEIFYNTT
jgi:hypothetical protein